MSDKVEKAESAFNEKQWALFCHLGAFAGYIVPFGNIIVPLIIWSSKKDESGLIDKAGKESINFQISMTIYIIISVILMILLIGFFLLAALCILNIILILIAAMKTDKGEDYEYPLTIRFIN